MSLFSRLFGSKTPEASVDMLVEYQGFHITPEPM
jgi:hypothetical protein